MSSVIISGDTSGAVTVAAPAVAGTNTLTLQAATGTIALQGDVLGIGQTWQTVTRTSGTTYTNSTGRTIAQSTTANISTGCTVVVNGVTIMNTGSIANINCLFFVIPPGATYSVTAGSGYPAGGTVTELR